MTTEADIKGMVEDIGKRARAAGHVLSQTATDQKNRALAEAAKKLRANKNALIAANAGDMEAGEAKGLAKAMLDRLLLNDDRIEGMAKGLEDIARLDDPVGTTLAGWKRPNGLRIERRRTPLGVIGVIYESRPNVTADAGGLCLKAGNAAILRGGSESFRSSAAILDCLQEGLNAANLPVDAIQRIPTTDRAAVGEMLRLTDHIDVIVPRGGKSLIERVTAESKVPLFKHLEGLCHSYVEKSADPDKARDVVLNAKMRRTGICGATETVLIDKEAAPAILPGVLTALSEAGCEIRGDASVRDIYPAALEAMDEDWDTEYLDSIVSVKIVDGMEDALAHIRNHGSDHTDAIITEDAGAAETFVNAVDSAIVMVNASTQFADGGEFGMGAEIGIATGKLHARGPVGVEQLTSFKYVVRGAGQTRP